MLDLLAAGYDTAQISATLHLSGKTVPDHPTGRSLDVRRPGWRLDTDAVLDEAPAMTEQRYSIPVDDLVASARVPVTEQVEVQAEPQVPSSDWSTGPNPYGDGMSGDVDGD